MTNKEPAAVARAHRSLADPIRIRIFEELSVGSRTVRELADLLGMPADRLYYHLDLLEGGGVVRLGAVRPKRVYELAAPLRDGLGPTGPGDSSALTAAVLEAARAEAGTVPERETEPSGTVLGYQTLHLGAEDLERVRDTLGELLAELSELEPAPGRRRTRFVFAAFPLPD